jgi:hypothetical protein
MICNNNFHEDRQKKKERERESTAGREDSKFKSSKQEIVASQKPAS